jgi:hypothetical protein
MGVHMSDPDHPEHLQPMIHDIMARLGFPDEPKANGQDFDEKLTGALYVIWQVLARVCGIASLEAYIHENPGLTEKQLKSFFIQCANASGDFQPEFLAVAGKMIDWRPPEKKGKRFKRR